MILFEQNLNRLLIKVLLTLKELSDRGTPGNFKGFRVLAALLHGTL